MQCTFIQDRTYFYHTSKILFTYMGKDVFKWSFVVKGGGGGFTTFAKGVITVFQRIITRLRTEALYILHHIYHDFKQIQYQVVYCSTTFKFQIVFSSNLLTPSLIPVQQVFQKQKLNNLLFVAAFLEHPSTQECYYAMLPHMLMLAIPTLVSVSEGFRKK